MTVLLPLTQLDSSHNILVAICFCKLNFVVVGMVCIHSFSHVTQHNVKDNTKSQNRLSFPLWPLSCCAT